MAELTSEGQAREEMAEKYERNQESTATRSQGRISRILLTFLGAIRCELKKN